MPLYDYVCDIDGPFREWQPMSQCDRDVECPICGSPSKRSIAMPFLGRVDRNVRIAHERNERSAEEPKVMARPDLLAAHGSITPRDRDPRRRPGRNMYRSSMLGHAH